MLSNQDSHLLHYYRANIILAREYAQWEYYPEAYPPFNTETPSLTNPDDTDNMYAWYREYIITSNVSHTFGFAYIEHVQLALWDDTRATEYFRLDFYEDTSTFSKSNEHVANCIDLNTTASTYASSGNYLNITWHIWIHWNFTDLASDSDSWQYVNDTDGYSDTDWHETNWDPISLCSVTENYLDDGIGTANRGTYGLQDSIWANGTFSYLIGVGGGDNYPPVDRVDLWINSSSCAYSPWSVTSYDDSTGEFSVLVDSGDTPKINPNYDLYQVTAVEEGGAFSSDNFVNGGTDDYKPDIIDVTAFNQASERVDINTAADMEVELKYHYDATLVGTGSFSCNGTSMSWNGGTFKWDLLPTESTVQGINYSLIIGADTTHGVVAVNMSGYYKFQIWDRLVIDIQADDETPYNDEQVYFTITVTYDYDDSSCTTYTIEVNRSSVHWYWFTNANKSNCQDTASSITYSYVAVSGSDTTYGLTVFISNTESVTWSGTAPPPPYGFPDEYGQGIQGIWIFENSTGSWEPFYFARWDDVPSANPPYVFEWNVSTGIKIEVFGYINYTLVGFNTVDEGKLYQRHYISVVDRNNTLLFSQQNLTYVSAHNTTYPPNDVWAYRYDAILDFAQDYGEYYTVTVVYEIYYEGEWHIVGIAIIYFSTPLDTWGLYTAIMILGLIMIPVSGLYLVKGGRKEASMNKVYYALIIFFVGWALFLGGIMP